MQTVQTPLITIVIPAYNAEKTLIRSVSSAIEQDYSQIEIIIVDDGSTDSTFKIALNLSNRDSRIKVTRKSNGGLSSARNAGLAIASGSFIYFLDSDDYIDSVVISDLVRSIDSTGADMAVGGFTYVDEDGHFLGKVMASESLLDEKRYWESAYLVSSDCYVEHVVSWGKLINMKILKDVQFDEGKIHEDEFIIHKITHRCRSISLVQTTGYYYVQRSGSIMSTENAASYLDAMEALITRAYLFKGYGWYPVASNVVRFSFRNIALAYRAGIPENQRKRFNEYVRLFWKLFLVTTAYSGRTIKETLSYGCFRYCPFLHNLFHKLSNRNIV